MRYYPSAGPDGQGDWVPSAYWEEGEEFEEEKNGYFVELSASGYLDRTGWSGPFETEEDARRHVIDQWEVDPDNGDELPEDLTDEDVEAMVAGEYEGEDE